MCPTSRGPPHQTQLPDKDATYLERAHNSRFVPRNKTAVLDLVDGILILKPAPLLFFQIQAEAQAATVDPTVADLAQSPYSQRV